MSGSELVDEEQQVHVTLHDSIGPGEGCPEGYVWHSTGESRIVVVQRVRGGPRREEDLPELRPDEVLIAAGFNLKLEQAFYQLRKRFQQLSKDQKLSCSDMRALTNTDKPDTSLQAQYLTFARGETLYSLRCKKREAYVATDWDTKACYREMPIWIYTKNNQRKLRFLAPGSRLLLNSSRPENCTQAKIVPHGYQATSGAWVALTPDLQLIQSPPEMIFEQAEIELDPEKASHGRAYQTEALLRWSEFHHRQYRRRLAAQHLDQHALGVIGGYQLQAGASAQEFGSFLKILEAAGPCGQD